MDEFCVVVRRGARSPGGREGAEDDRSRAGGGAADTQVAVGRAGPVLPLAGAGHLAAVVVGRGLRVLRALGVDARRRPQGEQRPGAAKNDDDSEGVLHGWKIPVGPVRRYCLSLARPIILLGRARPWSTWGWTPGATSPWRREASATGPGAALDRWYLGAAGAVRLERRSGGPAPVAVALNPNLRASLEAVLGRHSAAAALVRFVRIVLLAAPMGGRRTRPTQNPRLSDPPASGSG